MPTLHIEHAISDFDTWRSAFARFAEVRAQAGVRGQTVRRPVDDPRYVMIDLDFDTAEAAENFRTFLQQRVWSSSESAPALVGTPRTTILGPPESR